MTSALTSCQADMAGLPSDYEELLNWADLVVRAMRNPKLSPAYFRLFLSLLDTYPEILRGARVPVQVWRVRENAGWAKERVTTNFFQDMNAINALIYEPGAYSKAAEDRVGYITATPNTPYPESFDVMNVERKRKAREAEEKRRKQFQDPRKLMQCPVCGSEDLLFDVVAHCRCGYSAEPVRDIPASDIIIEAEIIEIEDDPFVDPEPTAKLPIIRPAGVEISQGELRQMEQMMLDRKDLTGLARPDEPCLKCGRARKICHENSEGTWWYSCTPEMWRAYEESKGAN